jgi:hypothetical protein
VRGFCLPPAICRAERRQVERILVDALSGLEGELAGIYYPLSSMTPEQEQRLIEVSMPFCALRGLIAFTYRRKPRYYIRYYFVIFNKWRGYLSSC